MDIADPRYPTAQTVRDMIDQDGGPLVPAALGRTLRSEDLLHMMVSVDFLQQELNRYSSNNGGPQVSVHYTRSPSMRTSIRQVSRDHAAILVPVGTLARLQVMHRLLLGYWSRDESTLDIIASIWDRPFKRRLPLALVPLLDDLEGADGEHLWWEALDALNDTIELDPAFAPDVSELNHLSLSLLLSHEFAHVARHHHELRRRVRVRELLFEVGDGNHRRAGTDAELARAMENDADLLAAYLVVLTMVSQCDIQPKSLLPRGFVRIGYALSALLALFDPKRLSIMEFGENASYPHPLVRQNAYLDNATKCAHALGLKAVFEDNALYGAKKCLYALRSIEFDILTRRRFCTADEQPDPVIHALRPQRGFRIYEECLKEEALTLRLGTLISGTYGEFNFRS